MKLLHSYRICVVYLLVSPGLVHSTMLIIDSFGRTVDNFPIRYATFIDVALEGYIEYANPPDACSEIRPPNFPQNFTMKKIVLVNGTTSTCDFMAKVQNAKAGGYDTAVLFDPWPGPFEYPNMTFPLPRSEVNLSVVLMLHEDGIVIINNYLHHNISDKETFIIRIYGTVTWVDRIRFMCYVCMSFVSMFFIGYVLIAILKWIWYSCVNLCKNRNEEHNGVFENRNEEHNGDLDPLIRALHDVMTQIIEEHNGDQRTEEQRRSALCNLNKRFPTEEFSQDHPFQVCVICREDFQVGERIRALGCPHGFHADCIDPWLVIKATCPMCKAEVNLENSYEHSPSYTTETTPLLTSNHSLYSCSRTSNGSGLLDAAYDNSLHLTDESSELLAGAQGSVNYVHVNDSDEDIQWFDA